MNKIKVSIVYPADPVGSIPGGIETCIRGILKWVPDDIYMSLVGVTTDRALRPVGQWTKCSLGEKEFNFFPVLSLDNTCKQMKIPLSLRFTTALAIKQVRHEYNVLQFHRIEPTLLYIFDKTPKNVFIHTNMQVLRNKKSSIRWRYLPWMYYKLEDFLLTYFNCIFVVQEDAASAYKKRYPEMADKFHFLPTWMDPNIFYVPKECVKAKIRSQLFAQHGFRNDYIIMISVGRLDHEKDPVLLIDAFSEVVAKQPNARLIIIGDGILKPAVIARISHQGLKNKVVLTGLLPTPEVTSYLRAADLLVLSSVYEGMPRVVLEAMGCGVPVVTTDVGEVRRVVKPGVNGEIAFNRTTEDFASAIISCIKNLSRYRGKPCLDVTSQYVPEKVLEPVYENYRRLAKKGT